jgi:sensor domain CHASE-containing protein
MSIRSKTVAALGLTLVGLVVVLYGVLGAVCNAGFGAVERQDASRNMERVREAYAGSLQSLAEKVGDWAVWDDTYRFVVDKNQAYVTANQTGAPFQSMRLDLMMFCDAEGRPVRVMAYDRKGDHEVLPPQRLIAEHLGPGSAQLRFASLEERHQGTLFTDGYPPLLFVTAPIVTSEGKGPSHGTLVFGAWFDRDRQAELERLTRLKLSCQSGPTAGLTGGWRDAAGALADRDFIVNEASESALAGFTAFRDPSGQRQLLVRAEIPRDVHRQAQATMRYILIALALVGLVFMGVILTLLDRVVLRRVSRLASVLSGVSSSFDFGQRVDEGGADEISRLGREVNGLLAASEQVMFQTMPGAVESAGQADAERAA